MAANRTYTEGLYVYLPSIRHDARDHGWILLVRDVQHDSRHTVRKQRRAAINFLWVLGILG